MKEDRSANPMEGEKIRYWAGVGFRVREGMKMHQATGQLKKGPDSWRNVTEHCLVQVARSEALGRLIGLPEDLISDIRTGALLHDFHKKQEITATRQANESGTSPLAAVKLEQEKSENMLRAVGFSGRVIRLASSAGGYAPQLIETKRILDQEDLSDEDLAYLVCHYVDDCSVGSDWVKPIFQGPDVRRLNIIDYRAEENKSKPTYEKISEEIGEELKGTVFEDMNNHDVMAEVSHQIEQRFASLIRNSRGEIVDPLKIPELVDQKIRQAITNG